MTEQSSAADLLRRGIEILGIPDADKVSSLMELYLDELERWNPRFGLVKAADRRELVVKHVLDSLCGWRAVDGVLDEERGTVLDVGSGAGFPGIPLAAALPRASVTLMERMARRASFLRTCAVLLRLPGLRVAQSDLAEATGDFDVVTFRAVAPFGRFLQEAAQSGVRWRAAIAYKGREDRVREEVDDVRRSAFGADLDLRVEPVTAPFLDEERCLIVAEKRIVDKEVTPG